MLGDESGCAVIAGRGANRSLESGERAMFIRKVISLSALASVLAASTWLSAGLQTAASPQSGSSAVSDLFSRAKAQAGQLKLDANDMETFIRTKVNWESHAGKITDIKDHVNKLGDTVDKLNQMRDAASASQKMAIDRINPLLQQLAGNATAMIDHLNNERGRRLDTE